MAKIIETSEYVSTGHPDKVADYISSYVLDRFLERDAGVRYAVEVQVKDNHVTLAGEVTSAADFTEDRIREFVREAVRRIGYTREYAEAWGEGNALNAEDLDIRILISGQSPDIARGVDAEGWGDQGIFWGMAVNCPERNDMPRDHEMAKKICQSLYRIAKAGEPGRLGIDIKTQIEMIDGQVSKVVVAIPMKEDRTDEVRSYVMEMIGGVEPKYGIVVNGTGSFVRHSSMGDCGTTGRKLVVDFYGGNCRIGGGSPWTKDPSKADVSLNLYARKLALHHVRMLGRDAVVRASVSSVIGRREIRVVLYGGDGAIIASFIEDKPPKDVIREMDLRRPRYADRCMWGLFNYM